MDSIIFRFLLPYERHVKGEEYKPLPISERRRLKSKAGSSTSDDADETSEGTSRSGNSTPVPQLIGAASPPITPTSSPESSNKVCNCIIQNVLIYFMRRQIIY